MQPIFMLDSLIFLGVKQIKLGGPRRAVLCRPVANVAFMYSCTNSSCCYRYKLYMYGSRVDLHVPCDGTMDGTCTGTI